ncbi:unnamed protein product [Caenorhabditis auriculariae]|uniref:Uncharacterized protein n=1 Tax=Caenorhabditis auriculariae TaxID=2777116 RepID=A0A8S1HH19_9PELO|nr:unnamed protein product [Caenorhabditis auriculariae]
MAQLLAYSSSSLGKNQRNSPKNLIRRDSGPKLVSPTPSDKTSKGGLGRINSGQFVWACHHNHTPWRRGRKVGVDGMVEVGTNLGPNLDNFFKLGPS